MAIRRRCLAPLPFMTGFYVAAGFTFQQILFVSADLQSAMLCVTEFMQSADCRRRRSSPSGSKNHRTTLLVAAVRKSASEVPLASSMLRIVRSQPRTASLLSGNSVLHAGFFRRRLAPPRLPSVFQRFCSGIARGEPSAELPATRVRRTAADNKPASTCCGLQISVNLQASRCALNGLFRRPIIRAHAVIGCSVGFEIQ